MAESATWQQLDATPQATPERQHRQRAFLAARRHSRLVRRLRFLLPLAGTMVVVLLFGLTRFYLPDDLDLSVARLSVTRNSIIMDNPLLTGFDADKRAYPVAADRAIQALANPAAVQLETIRAQVTVTGQGTTKITAEAGDYDNAESTLKLHGDVAVDSTEGYAVRMRDADIDFKAGSMASPNPVSVRYEGSETVGQSISVSEGGQIIVLEGGVRTTLMPPKQRTVPAAAGPAPEGRPP
jgi:lipopolysaccharide export system protein LptC